ncbi:MAG: AprI/Inh family metalloprotease inhibitor [Methylacidiphilales bacterium]|nr:AprI/Inh family metalloprotease inhibitor [Candidatus Methylacidiphilales bacterium]
MIAVPTQHLLVAALSATVLGGCAIERTLVLDSAPAEPPVSAAPTTPVTGSALPPPAGASAAETALAPPPAAPTEVRSGVSGGFPSILDDSPAPDSTSVPSEQPPPRIAPGAQAAGLGGTWTLAVNDQSCRLTLQEPPASRTGWAQAEPGCTGFANAASWTLSGNQLFVYDRNTRPLGRLTTSGPNRFDGTATQGATISLTR